MTAAEAAAGRVAAVRDDPAGRRALLQSTYDLPRGLPHRPVPYRRAAVAFMDWQLRRGLLDPATASPWWRATYAAPLRDSWEARDSPWPAGASERSISGGHG